MLLPLLATSLNGFAQGGNTCAAAAAAPITIPFTTTTGTICAPATNDYNMVGAGCIDPLNTQGPDWLYYFCAPTTGTINITLNNFFYYCIDPANVAPFPALSVWQGCPNVGTCVAGSTSQGTPYLVTSPETSIEMAVTAGQCYYILIDNYPGYCPCFDYDMNVMYVTPPPVQPACTNMGFDAGTFAGWSGTYGYTIVNGAPGAPSPTYTPAHYTTLAPHHTITAGAGVDPFGGFPVVRPGGGTNSMRLGDGTGYGYGGASLEQTFNVSVANALLTYHYAAVVQDANSGASVHTNEQQPFFKIEVFDCAGVPITCGQYLVVGGPGIPGFVLAPGTTDVYYKPWTPVAIDLTPYIGSCVKIKFTVGDCSLGAHFSYAYLDVVCAPMAITGVNMICPGTSTTLFAPPGEAAYLWAPGGQTTSSVTVSPASATTYTCTVTSVSGPTCTSVLTYPVGLYPAVTATSTSQTVCNGTAATITATPSTGGGTFSWAPGGQTTASITVSPATTTTYTVTYTDLNGCTDTAMGTVVVNPLPTVVVNSPSICVGSTANLTATGAASYAWSAGVTVTGLGTADAGPGTTTSYTVTGTSAAGCTNTAVSTVTVNPIPVVNVNSPTICPGQTANLTATGATSYTWSAGATSTGVNTANATPAATTSYTVTGTSLGCFSTAVSTVTVSPPVIVNVNSPTICNGQTANLTAGGATTYAWSAGATSTGVNTANASPAATTTYTVTGTTSGCTGTAVSTVTVDPLPVTVVNSPTICAGATANLTAGGAATYAWSAGATSTGVNTADATPAATTTYTVTGTSLGCTSTAVSTVTVNPIPVVNVNSPTICPTQTASLTATGATSYAWSTGATSTGVNTADATPAATTTYTVTGTSLGCSGTAVSAVTVGGTIVVNVNSPAICAGQTANLTATGGTTYVWSAGATTTGVNTANATPAATTSYTVTGTTSGCSGTAVSTVTVNPMPVTIVNSPAVCAGITANLTAGGATTYAWSAGATSTGVNTADASPAATTTYTVTGTSLGCSTTAVSTVTINPAPVSDAGPDIVVCTGSTGNIGAANVAGYTYVWSPAAGLSSTSISDPAVTIVNGGSAPIVSNYTVTTTETATGCTSSDAVTVTVNAVPTANAGSAQFVCTGASITLAGAIGGSATGGTWSGGAGIFSPNNTTLNAVYTPTAAEYAADSVVLTLTTNDPAGPCTFASSNVTFYFYPNPVANFTVVNPVGCPIQCASFFDLSTMTAPFNIVSWAWTFGDGATSTTQNPTHCYNATGLYNVTLTVTSNMGCTDVFTIVNAVEVYAVPAAQFTMSPNPGSLLESTVNILDLSSNDVVNWYWNYGDGSIDWPGVQNPTHTFPNQAPGVYTVELIVVNSDGCYDTIAHDLVIGPEFTFYIPNCVTPNDDGVNDYFFGDGVGIIDYDIWIFDRWGMMIFHGSYLYDKWDGRANGGAEVAQQDVYVWKVTLTDVFNKVHNYIGTVTIVK